MFTHAGGGIVLSGVLLDVAGLLSMTRMIRTAAP
jgi:hypothetical protein